MTGRMSARLAWALCGTAIVLQALGWSLSAVQDDITPAFDLASGAALLVLPVVGALIASKHPGNAIGWLFCGAGTLLSLAGATYGYAAYALAAEPKLPGGVLSAWLASWIFLPAVFGIPPLLFLLFPDGRPLTARWRLAVALSALGLVCQSAGAAFRPGLLVDSPVPGIENPVGIDLAGVVGVIEVIGWVAALGGIVLATWSLVRRYRLARGDERLQLRWFAFSAVLFVVACVISTGLFQTRFAAAGQVLVVVAFSTIPAAAGMAILRHRLYDIDLVINRTLVYAVLSATLVATYLASVLVFRLLLSPLTGDSNLAVAGSTLAVAALFRPARARIQGAVDRRFYRARYDAARTLEAFNATLRTELNLEALATDLRRVVADTMQPAHVRLWLRS